MDVEGKLRFAAQGLADAEGILQKAADAYPFLDGPGRAFKRMAKAVNRPLRIGILGETNSGKSSLANLLAGVSALPADPVAHTALPALLKYASQPSVTAVYGNGQRIAFPVRQSVARVVASIQDSSVKSGLPAGGSVPPSDLKVLEVGLPSSMLRSVEILDLAAGSQGLQGYPIDAAIWTTVATQAWRETERAQWTKLPQAMRSRSLLAVTFSDLAAGKGNNLKRLQARLESSAKPHFRGICFVENGDEDPAAAAARNQVLFVQIQYLAQEFAAWRMGKAMEIARRVMAGAISKLAPGAELGSNGITHRDVAEASRGLFDEDWVAVLKQPLPPGEVEKPSILRSPAGSGASPKPARGHRAWGAGANSGGRPQWMTAGAAALVGGAVALVAVQSGLIGGGGSPASSNSPGAPQAVEQSAKAEAEQRRNAEAAAAAVEARRKAEAETAASESRRKAEAEAAAKSRMKAEAEAAAAEARRTAEAAAAAAEARRKAEAEVAAAEARRKAQAEAAAAEARRKAEAAAAAAEARMKAEAEAAVAEARRRAEAEAAAAEARKKAEAEAAVAEARRRAESLAAAAEARRKLEEASAAEERKRAEAEASAAEERRQAEAEAAVVEERRKAEAVAAEARKKAEAAAAEARRRKKAEADAAEAERRRRAEAEEAERHRRAAAEAPVHRSGGSSPIMHGIGN